MSEKIKIFMRTLFLALGWGVFSFWFAIGNASLHITCTLQNDGTYSCNAKHEVLGVGVTNLQADQVVETKEITRCSGPNLDKRCAYVPYFVTNDGAEIEISNKYTSNLKKVDTLTQSVNEDMASKKAEIDHTGAGGWAIYQICMLSLAPFIILLALIKLFQQPNESGKARTIISWKKPGDTN